MKTKIGATLIVLAYLISLNLYLMFIAIPVFIVGVILLWLGKKTLQTKIAWTVLPIVLWYPGLVLVMYLF